LLDVGDSRKKPIGPDWFATLIPSRPSGFSCSRVELPLLRHSWLLICSCVACYLARAHAYGNEPSWLLVKHFRSHSRTCRFNSARTSRSCNFTVGLALRIEPAPRYSCTDRLAAVQLLLPSSPCYNRRLRFTTSASGSPPLVHPTSERARVLDTAIAFPHLAQKLFTATPPARAVARHVVALHSYFSSPVAGPALAPALPCHSRARSNRVRSRPASHLGYTARVPQPQLHSHARASSSATSVPASDRHGRHCQTWPSRSLRPP
jgi:hypothetical protein